MRYNTFYRLYLKSVIDFIISIISILILSPLFLVICIIIKIDSPGPAFFKQKRVGIYCNDFYLIKFRTMKYNSPHDVPTHLLTNPDKWITSFGKYLRRTSLDELPQILNILTMKMSIVGPRPALWNQYDLIDERKRYGANNIKPGITGWAQINGRDNLTIIDKAKLDGEYVQKCSFAFDFKCLLLTISSLIRKDGIVEGKID